MRTIDADTVVTIQVYDDMTEETDTKKMTIAEAIDEWSDEGCPPTVDAVEVVRCKDCRYYHVYYESNGHAEKGYGACDWINDKSVREDHFCSWGERREDER